jgi:cysteine-rich repeat protein
MRQRRWRSALALVGLSSIAAGTFSGCGKVDSSRGGLMLLVSTDGPLAIDRVDIAIDADGRSLLSNKYRVPAELGLPTSVAIVSNGDATAQASISVTGWSGNVPLDRRDAIVTQIPTDRVVALNVVLSARCSSKLTVSVDGNAVSSCGDGSTCDNAGNCVTVMIQASELPIYRTGDENDAGFAGTSSEDSGSLGGSGGESGFVGVDRAGADAVGAGAPGEGGNAGSSGSDAAGAAGASDEGCGNHLQDPGESCDDGGESTLCNANCTVSRCGDGVRNVTAGEQCDDGNTLSSDLCSATCLFEGCGNSKIDPGEVCDDGNTLPGDHCSADCRSTEACGNGTLDPGETCDDGNGILSDNCVDQKPNSCKLATCGDGFIDSADPRVEECDDAGESATCNRDCTRRSCGDKITNQTAGEECDDGGETSRCNANCKFARCGDFATNPAAGEQCDSGALQTATCEATCKTPRCGDSIKNAATGEQCDDGGIQSASCEANCKAPRCGDSILNPFSEQCEPPNTAKCDSACKNK